MDIQQRIHHYFPWASTQTPAEIDAEIREELEFHLEMRTEENIAAGMSLEEARRDAQQRFGDFETHRTACRRITLWPSLIVARLQTALVVVLIGVVVYQGMLLLRLQKKHHAQIESLRQMVVDVQAASDSTSPASAVMPYVQFKQQPTPIASESPSSNVLSQWRSEDPTRQPWSDWQQLNSANESIPPTRKSTHNTP